MTAHKTLMPASTATMAMVMFFLAPAAVHAAAGSVQFVSGEARIVLASGNERVAQKGVELNEGDTVITGRGASVQLRMADEGLIALRPETQLKIDTYRYGGLEDGNERGVLALVRGGFRTLTGIIGRTNKRNYQVNTPNATIGIRGTDHEIVHIPTPAAGETPLGTPGTYNKVNVGETFVQTQGGRIDLSANQVGFAGLAPGLAPIKLDSVPAFLRATPQQQSRDERRQQGRESAQGDQRRIAQEQPQQGQGNQGQGNQNRDNRNNGNLGNLGNNGNNGQFGPQNGGPELPHQTPDGNNTFTGGGTSLAAATPPGYSGVGGDKGPNGLGSGTIVASPGGSAILFGPDGQVAILADVNGFRYVRNGAFIADTGGAVLNDNGTAVPVKWGVYAGGTIIDNQGTRLANFFHFMSAQGTPSNVVANLSGTFNNVFAQTKLITEGGALGGNINSASMTVNTGQLTSYQMNLTDALARTWNACAFACSVGSAPLTQFAKQGVVIVATSAAGSAAGKAQGIVIGPSGAGIISSFDFKTLAGLGVTGSFAVK